MTRVPFCLLLLAILCAGKANAQDCKPIRANRGKALANIRVAQMALSWMDYSMNGRFEWRGSEVIFRMKDSVAARFTVTRGGEVLAPYIVYKGANGAKSVDTIDAKRLGKYNHYFNGAFHSRHVRSSFIPSENRTVYYSTTGADSAIFIRYDNSVFQQMTLKDSRGIRDSVDMTWSPEGILLHKRTMREETTYHPTGTLQTRQLRDPHTSVVRRELFYPSGILQLVAYFANGPAGTWRYYDSTGALQRSEKHRPLSSLPAPVIIEAPAVEPPIFLNVEQQAEFRYLFEDTLAKAIVRALRCSSEPLDGAYEVEYALGDDGVAALHGIRGLNATAMEPSLRQFFASLKDWKLGKFNGRPVTQIMLAMLSIERPAAPR